MGSGEPRLWDVSPAVGEGIGVWPGDAPYEQRWSWSLADGDSVNVARVALSTHTGAHADAALHVRADGADAATMPLEPYWGRARLVDHRGRGPVDAAAVAALRPPLPPRILWRTRPAGAPLVFDETIAYFTPEAARGLVDLGARLVGIDTPSVDAFTSRELAAHHVFFDAGVAVLESLELGEVPPGEYELAALPLRLAGADASPVRAALRTVG